MKHEKVDTRALLNGEAGDANYTDPKVRLAERAKVLDYWPEGLTQQIRRGFLEPPPWRLLLDPTGWGDVPRERVHAYVRGALEYGRWPSIDGLHRAFGRVTNHRGADEVEAQESLL